MFGTLGGPELFLIMVVALIVFGPRKLPEMGKSLGKMMAEFRKASNDFKRTIEDEVEAEKLREATRIEVPSWNSEPAQAALPPANVDSAIVDPADDSTAAVPEPNSAVSEESAPELAQDLPAETATVSSEAPGKAPIEAAPPAETVSRGALPGLTK